MLDILSFSAIAIFLNSLLYLQTIRLALREFGGVFRHEYASFPFDFCCLPAGAPRAIVRSLVPMFYTRLAILVDPKA